MDVASVAASLVGPQMGQVRTSAAANMLRINAESAASIIKVIEAAQQNIDELTKSAVADGLGGNVDISVSATDLKVPHRSGTSIRKAALDSKLA